MADSAPEIYRLAAATDSVRSRPFARFAAIALDVPPVTEMMFQLKERGIDVDTGALTLREAEESIYDYLRGSKAK